MNKSNLRKPVFTKIFSFYFFLYGYQFVPTKNELVLGYLLNKAKGKPLPFEAVIDCEIYGDDFWWELVQKGLTSPSWKEKKKSKWTRIKRIASCGTWKGYRTEPVKDS